MANHPRRLAWRRTLLVILIALCLGLASYSRSQAHAYLVRSEPADNSALEEPPKEIRLWFSEAFTPKLSSIRVVDLNGNQVQPLSVGADASDPTVMVAEMPPLSPGVYTVNWVALSAEDGHPSQGFFVFRIGPGAAQPGASLGGRRSAWLAATLPDATLRVLNYLSLMLAVGGIGVLLWVLRPEATSDPAQKTLYLAARRRVLLLSAVASAFAFLVGFAQLFWQASLLAKNFSGGASLFRLALDSILQWPWGYAWIVRQLAWLVLFALAARGSRMVQSAASPNRRLPVWMAFLAGIALLAQSLSSHAAALDHPAIPLLVDAIHLAVVGLWIGGLAALAVGLLPLLLRDRSVFNDLARRAWRPFSRLAAVSVGLVLATGVYSTAQEVISPDALLLSPYGRFLSGKVALFSLAGLVGLFNSMLLNPRLAAPLRNLFHKPAGWTPLRMEHFPRLVLIEASLGLVIVGLVGFLTTQTPAENIAYLIPSENPPDDVAKLVNDLLIHFSIKPDRPGDNLVDVRVINTRRPPPAEILRVIVRMTYLEQESGTTSQDAEFVSTEGTTDSTSVYHLATHSITQPGRWSVEVVVRRKGMPDSVVTAPWTVLPVQDIGPTLISRAPWRVWLEILAGTIVIIVLLLAFLLRPKPSELINNPDH